MLTHLGLLLHTNTAIGLSAAEHLNGYVKLARDAEDSGLSSIWARDRHFEAGYIPSPFVFFAAAAQHTQHLRFGTGVTALRFENPVRLAEDAATADLLSGERLELGVSDSRRLFHNHDDEALGVSSDFDRDRLAEFRRALAGVPFATSSPDAPDLRVFPQSPSLTERIWYGSGSLESAQRAGDEGLSLFVSTVTQVASGSVVDAQHQQIETYRTARQRRAAAGPANVGVCRFVLPVTSPETRRRYTAFSEWYEKQGAIARDQLSTLGVSFRQAPVYLGEPAEIIDRLLGESAVDAANTLLFALPHDGTFDEYRRLIADLAETVSPALTGARRAA